MPDDDIIKTCKITNNSGIDLVVTIPAEAGESFGPTSKVTFNKDVELLVTSENGPVIPSGKSGTVTLDHSFKSSSTGLQTYVTDYDLQYATADWYVPFFLDTVELDDDSGGFDDRTVSPDGPAAQKDTMLFYQGVSAFPNTKLAQDYVAALSQSGNSLTSTRSKKSAVDTFFAQTKQYQRVTGLSVIALENYLNQFPFAWARNGNITYYLYSADGKTCRFEGTMVLTRPAAIDITKPNGGYTVTFNPATDPTDTSSISVDTASAKPITYVSGLFLDDVNSDIPNIALKGSYQVKRTFTKVSTDNMIIPVMSGTINGVTALGFDGSQATTKDDTTQDWVNSMFHPKTAAEIWNSVMQILGALMMLHFVGGLAWSVGKWIRKKATAKPPTDEEIAAEKGSLMDRMKAEIKSRYKKLRGGKDEDLPADSKDAVDKAATEKNSLGDEVSASKAQTNLRSMEDSLRDAKPFASTQDQVAEVDSLSSELSTNYRTLNNTEASGLKDVLTQMKEQLKTLSENVSKINSDIQQMASEAQKGEIQDSVDAAKKVQEDIEDEETVNKEDENLPEDDNPPFEGLDG